MPRLFLFFFLLRAAFHGAGYRFPGTLLTYSNKSVSSTPGQREKLLQQKGGEMNRSLLGGKGNEIPRNHHLSRIPDQVGRKCSKGAKLVTRPLDSANNVVKTNNEPVKLFELTTESLVKRAIKIALSRDLIVGSALRAPLWIVVTLTHVKTRQQYPYIYIYTIFMYT